MMPKVSSGHPQTNQRLRNVNGGKISEDLRLDAGMRIGEKASPG